MSRSVPFWWDQLPENFSRQADQTDMDAEHRYKVIGTAGMDRVMRTALSTVIATALGSTMWRHGKLDAELMRLRFYERVAQRADPQVSFPEPKPAVVKTMRPPALAYRPMGIPCCQLSFDSPFVALQPTLRESYAKQKSNAKAYAQHWCHPQGPRPTMVVIHGYAADSYAFNAQMFSLRWFYRQGYDILLYTLPFHGHRVERWDWFSGHRLFSGGLAQFNEGMAHAIHDLRIFIDYLRRNGVDQLGVTGLSLGGYTAALLAAIDDELAFCIPNSPVISPVDLALEWQPTGLLLGSALRNQGVSVQELRGMLAMHSPLTYSPKTSPDRMMIIGGAGDRFVPPRHVRLLHAHWPGSRLHWFPGNHLLHLHQGEYLRAMKKFMDKCTA